MLRIDDQPTFARPVIANVPEGTGHREDRFQATFKALPIDQFNGFDLSTEAGTREFLTTTIVRLDDLADANDRPVTYSEAVRDQVLNLPWTRRPLVEAYVLGIAEAARGNSAGSPLPG